MGDINLPEAVMQSFTSIGPMLEFIALFSVIAVYSGTLLPFVILFSFLLSYFTLYTVYSLSGLFITNGGYYSYVGHILGKDWGIFIFLIYFGYSVLTVPNIANFISGFASNILSIYNFNNNHFIYILILIFILLVYITVGSGIKKSIKYTFIAGILEISFIILLSIIFILTGRNSIGDYKINFHLNQFFFGIIFGILAFSGGGSSIFLSEKTNNARRNTPKSLFISFTISGIIMTISAFSLLYAIGNHGILEYSINSFYIVSFIKERYGPIFLMIFSFFGILSGFNLSVSYLNAFVHMFPRFQSDFGFNKYMGEKKLLFIMFIITSVISISTTYIAGPFTSFVIIAGVISFFYIIIHIISNISLYKARRKNMIIPMISSILLTIAFIISFISNTGFFIVINYAVLVYLLISVISIIYIKRMKNTIYKKIKFEHLKV
ncbi:amino acid permease [Acidiplasma sp.]|uniref:amino acid permease n=1 Tax=Acidiplasma sp. TaxID=1872114 RepID=UPI00258A6F9C|nr:amino acid permease [Acidiplasma sp.]